MLYQVCEDLHRQVSVVRQQDEGSEVMSTGVSTCVVMR